MEKINAIWLILYFSLFTIIITYPLILHMDSLSGKTILQYKAGDTELSIDSLERTKSELFSSKFVSKEYETTVTYLLFGGVMFKLFGTSAIFSHNLFFLISVFLSGLAMYYLVYEFSKDELSSLFVGSVYCSSIYIKSEFLWGHVNIMQIQWIPAIFLFFEKTLFNPNLKNSLILGLLMALQVLSSSQYSIYLSLFLLTYMLIRKRNFYRSYKLIVYMWLAICIGFLISSPYLIERHYAGGVVRSIAMNNYYSLESLDSLLEQGGKYSFSWTLITLFLVGIYLTYRKKIKVTIPFIVIFILSATMMFGPINEFMPYTLLYKYWPFVNLHRTPIRMYIFSLMSLLVIASIALSEIMKIKILSGNKILRYSLIFVLFLLNLRVMYL